MSNSKILILDIETSPIMASVWGLYDQNVGLEQIQADWHLLSFGAKWINSKEVIYMDQSKAKDVEDDTPLLVKLHQLLNEADIVIGHNFRRFDQKKINARLIMQGFGPPSPYKIIDTLEIAKRHFAFSSNKLAFLSQHLCKFKKLEHAKFAGFKLWRQCLAGNKAAWKEMRLYNIRDIFSCEELYIKLRSWDSRHPAIGLYMTKDSVCPKCGSSKVEKRGFSYTAVGKFQRVQCHGCMGWSRGASMVNTKSERMALLR